MIANKLLYYLANFTLQHSFEKIIIKLTEKEKKLIIFDVGCYKGVFTKNILKFDRKQKYKYADKDECFSEKINNMSYANCY